MFEIEEINVLSEISAHGCNAVDIAQIQARCEINF